jgi:hypothetical protein
MRWKGRNNHPHLWFAWYPVLTDDNVWVWLEHVERHIAAGLWAYELPKDKA